MAATAIRAVPQLARDIPPPTWGEDFARARKAHYNSTADLVLSLHSVGVSTSTATISRMESATSAPTAGGRQIVAVAALVLCDTHPERLGLSLDVLPRSVYDALFGGPNDTGGQDISPTRWYGGEVVSLRARRQSALSVAA